ncbi:MAG: hypothetical protein M1834_004613 [Cirrosporium novae-zelandiae]|nr:MAG: hypothetical protein M1834_004613 [Cirrosporium novae-zelandiae]
MTTTRPDQRPRSKSVFSIGSHKSHKSSGSKTKTSLHESHEEKAARTIHSKADPSLAMNEAQPSLVAMEKSNLGSLNSGQYKDVYGNPITDPDRCNPTRHRLERPLDTIRSFEAAIDKEYKEKEYGRRGSVATALDSDGYNYNSRRSSSYQGYNGHPSGQGSYYGRQSYRPDSTVGPPNTNSYYQQPPQQRVPRYNRMQPEPSSNSNGYANGNGNQNPYGAHGYQQSYDTVASSGGSHGTEPWGNSTDPSSENSSVDRLQHVAKQPDLGEQYGFNGFGGAPQLQPQLDDYQAQSNYGDANLYRNDGTSVAPQPMPVTAGRQPIQLGGSGSESTRPQQEYRASDEKRKSWFKRRFSKD